MVEEVSTSETSVSFYNDRLGRITTNTLRYKVASEINLYYRKCDNEEDRQHLLVLSCLNLHR
jgi:hypothetical protein